MSREGRTAEWRAGDGIKAMRAAAGRNAQGRMLFEECIVCAYFVRCYGFW